MPSKQWIVYPDDATLLETIRATGSVAGAGKALGITESSLRRRVESRGLTEEVRKLTLVHPKGEGVELIDDPRRVQADQLKAENKLLRKENAEYAKRLASEEEFFTRIVEATRVPTSVPKLRTPKQNPKLSPRSVICPVYDQQYGQFVQPSDTPAGLGRFSTAIFDQRLERWLEGTSGSIRDYAQSHRIEELILVLGGDHVEGDDIFAGQAWQLELDPPRQVWDLACKMDEAIRQLVRFAKEEIGVPKVGIYGVTGNHGKVGGKKAGARPSTYNWDWLFLMLLRDRLREEPIDQFQIEPGGSLLFGCADHIFLAVHGDEIRGWGGLPFYGLTRYDGRAMRLHRVLYDYLLMGHHHQPATIPNGSGEHIISGDWVGANNLSRFITAASRPQQRVLYVAQKYGIVEDSRIYFTNSTEAHESPPVHSVSA